MQEGIRQSLWNKIYGKAHVYKTGYFFFLYVFCFYRDANSWDATQHRVSRLLFFRRELKT